ncbi:ATP-dependent DNA helicase RecG [Gephyromycinifex aptenodytis]|uniref:ATP-dependent DNA helicase RecG n=1 Tax=Gephyromycinifex aptenodytis TaxID=2716227 RepID=UPI001445362C|nr:ATP-dependent DNA helicase RecG [Gephyromycinifex aptenodytis]
MSDLGTPLTRILPKPVANELAKSRDLQTIGDLLWFLPRRHLDAHTEVETLLEGDYLVVLGTVERAATRPMRRRHGQMLMATISTGTHELNLTFFSVHGHVSKLTPGTRALFAGTVKRFNGQWQLDHPVYEVIESSDGPQGEPAWPLVPVYLQVPRVPSWKIARCIESALAALEDLPDPLPAELRTRNSLPGFVESMRMMHLPATFAEREQGRKRLAYDEALTIQLVLAQRRREQQNAPAVPRHPTPGGLLETFDSRLPFTLTKGQQRVGSEIAADLARSHPMNRLLQGEVGSGKTLVALRAMLGVVDAGGQAALLAPTEVLAVQHHRSITQALGDLAEGGLLGGATGGTRVALLTGSASTARRREALLQAASGQAGIVIGTHALLEDRVQFADLGLVVVDEQHRFGVEQRDALRSKAHGSPHVLVMTATPIPRTVAMTVFGDMETSTLDELPAGRSPIATHVVDNPLWYERAWGRVAEEVAAGHQAFVVCPRIGLDGASAETPGNEPVEGELSFESEEETQRPVVGVVDMLTELRERPDLAGLRIEMLHGRMEADDKDTVMTAFAAGQIDVLVATTVIEVGVDVPNATVMVVMDADRFGVSQLHQLRGRIGRGQAPGLCLLVAHNPGAAAAERLAAVAGTTDGFELSQVDLATRREGDILGARQSGGRSQLRVLTLRRDEKVIGAAREDAARIIEADPTLATYPGLRAAVEDRIDAEQAAFLERG